MGLFSWFQNLGKKQMRTADMVNVLMKTATFFRNARDIGMHPVALQFYHSLNNSAMYNDKTQPEFFHWRNTALDCFSDSGRRHILELEKNKLGMCGWIPYSCDRMAKEIDLLVKEFNVIFPNAYTYVDELNETQSYAAHLVLALLCHYRDLTCGKNMMVGIHSDDTAMIQEQYKTWRSLPRFKTYDVLYTWPIMSSSYRLIDFVLDRGPFASASKVVPATTRLSEIESNAQVLDAWKSTDKGQAIISGFLPQIGIFVGDMLNLMAYKNNEYNKTQLEWIKCKMEQLAIKAQNSNDQAKIDHLQKLINKYAEEMRKLQAEIEQYQSYRGE